MKKLLLMAFAILTVSAFAAEENTNTVTQVENTNITAVQVQGADVSLGESFMVAFGMTSKTADVVQDTTSGVEGTPTTSSATAAAGVASVATVGAASAAANAASVNAANSTTIVTPYGKY